MLALVSTSKSLDYLIFHQSQLQKRLEIAASQIDFGTQFSSNRPDLPTIYAITPTYKRYTQKADLTRLSQTLMLVPNFHWIIIEDAEQISASVANLLKVKKIKHTYLAVKTQEGLLRKKNDPTWKKHRGVDQRNLGLKWIRDNVKDSNGVVYFADDDNTYDIDLFSEVRFYLVVFSECKQILLKQSDVKGI